MTLYKIKVTAALEAFTHISQCTGVFFVQCKRNIQILQGATLRYNIPIFKFITLQKRFTSE